MSKSGFLLTCSLSVLLAFSCQSQNAKILPGAYQMSSYLPFLEGKKIGLLVNQTSSIEDTHLLDTLLWYGVMVEKVFAPEHGFRGNKSNGALIKDTVDASTGIPIISLYGKNKKPSSQQLEDLDLVIYDIQDVGARFYTYISSMHYMMEACAENNIDFMILDRPNPNSDYIDGPVLKKEFSSFVGMHPIPIVYAMTPGEVAQMILGEGWLQMSDSLNLKVVEVKNWNHNLGYSLPIPPSPNLPNDQSIALYPSLCLFEGTTISVGRGTDFPFQVLGHPSDSRGDFTFTPMSIPHASKYPKHENQLCYGIDLRTVKPKRVLDLSYLIQFYKLSENKEGFFNDFFSKLAGTDQLQSQIQEGMSEEEIKESWQAELSKFKKMREKYLIYSD